jgi:hypothetical protein
MQTGFLFCLHEPAELRHDCLLTLAHNEGAKKENQTDKENNAQGNYEYSGFHRRAP